MKREELESQLKEELNHIPEDIRLSSQRLLRYAYNVKRRERMDVSKEVVLKACVDSVKKQDPFFEPKYDKEFFNW